MNQLAKHPRGITALSIFFLAGGLISFTAGLSLLFPRSLLADIWRVNPRAHEHLSGLGIWAVVLMFVVSICCALAGIGLWRRRWWGHRISIGLIGINLVGDVVNAVTGTEPRAIVGVPIALALLVYLLSQNVGRSFKQ